MELLLIYLWLKLDSLNTLIVIAGAVAAIATFGCFMFGSIEQEEIGITWGKRGVFAVVVCATLAVAMPSSKDVAILVGASYGLDLAKSSEGQKAWTLIRGKANELLDEELKKLTPPAK
jgi:NADH:ubiquinone oxidoreductase subunit 6 (subunit J)